MRSTPVAVVEAEVCCPSVLASDLDGEEAVELARAFAALGDPVRLRLLNLIASADDGEVCVCELVGPVARSQPTVSHHLRILADAGLVASEKRGKWSWFSIVPERLDAVRAALAPARG
jgi:ArsR family transcriptional regulator, arsenate/arsenite/antimonite-responsive transcriptional repressor